MSEEPREIIRRLNNKRQLIKYFKEIGYVVPNAWDYLFLSGSSIYSETKDKSEEEAKAYTLRIVKYYIQIYTHNPKIFTSKNITKGEAVNYQRIIPLSKIEELIDFCSEREWFQIRSILKFIKRKVLELR